MRPNGTSNFIWVFANSFTVSQFRERTGVFISRDCGSMQREKKCVFVSVMRTWQEMFKEWVEVEPKHVSNQCDAELIHLWGRYTGAEPSASVVSASTSQLCDAVWGLTCIIVACCEMEMLNLKWMPLPLGWGNFGFIFITDRNSPNEIQCSTVRLIWLTLLRSHPSNGKPVDTSTPPIPFLCRWLCWGSISFPPKNFWKMLMCWLCCSSSRCSCRGPSSRPPIMWPSKQASTCVGPYRSDVSSYSSCNSWVILSVHMDFFYCGFSSLPRLKSTTRSCVCAPPTCPWAS